MEITGGFRDVLNGVLGRLHFLMDALSVHSIKKIPVFYKV